MIFTDGKCKFLNGSDVCTLHKRKCSTSLCIYKINDDLIGAIKRTTKKSEVQE